MIPGGYYLKARKIQESWIAHAPPHVREIWDWILMKAFYEDGSVLKRGQLLTSYEQIIQGLHWMVGYRKMAYTRSHVETAMKAITKAGMITTTKTTRGMIITVCNYDVYQDPKKYENHSEIATRTTAKSERKPQSSHTIEEEGKEVETSKKIKKEDKKQAGFALPECVDSEVWEDFCIHRKAQKAPLTPGAIKKTISDLLKLKGEGNDPNEVLRQSMGRGWRGVFALKQDCLATNNGHRLDGAVNPSAMEDKYAGVTRTIDNTKM